MLIARAAGKDLGAVMRERIFEPLGMADTGFFVPPEKLDRFTTFYAPDPETGRAVGARRAGRQLVEQAADASPTRRAGCVSTIDDYWTFASMLAAGGTRDGVRDPLRRTVARMTADHVDRRAARGTRACSSPPHASWGLGMEVPARGSEASPLPCGYGWDGGSRHVVAHQRAPRRHRHPAHATGDDVARAAAGDSTTSGPA